MNEQQCAGPVGWRDRPAMSATDVIDLLALQRVCGCPGSRVDRVGDQFVENERPVLPFLADGLAALIEVGHLTLGEPDPATRAMRPVLVPPASAPDMSTYVTGRGIPPSRRRDRRCLTGSQKTTASPDGTFRAILPNTECAGPTITAVRPIGH